MCKHYNVVEVLLEYQAPLGIPNVSRWNSFVEGALACCLSYENLSVHILQPSVVKRKLNLATGNYTFNKMLALAYAKERCPAIDTHHLADCFVLADYWAKNFEDDDEPNQLNGKG